MYNSLLRKSSFQIWNVNNIFVWCSIPSRTCSKRPFSKYSCHIDTSRLICVSNQFTGLSMTRVFTERSFRIVYTTSDISFSYRQRLHITWRIKRFVLVAAPSFTDWLLHASLHSSVYFLIILFRICSVCAEYEKIWTLIRRPQYTAQMQKLL